MKCLNAKFDLLSASLHPQPSPTPLCSKEIAMVYYRTHLGNIYNLHHTSSGREVCAFVTICLKLYTNLLFKHDRGERGFSDHDLILENMFINQVRIRILDVFVVYFDQLLGAALIPKLVEILFSSRFQPFLFISNIFQ